MKNKINYYKYSWIPLLICLLYYYPFKNEKFYGFEHEDAFISSLISNSDNFFSYFNNFRTQGCDYYLENRCAIQTSYTGHYITYSFYLSLVDKVFNTDQHKTHKYGNLLLLMLWLFVLVYLMKNNTKSHMIIFSLCASLPFMYVVNSSLIENISICFGVFFVLLLKYQSEKNKINASQLILFILILSIIKRENLIYLLTIPFFINIKDLKSKKSIVSILIFIVIQFFINPFYTEILESNDLGRNTFSFKYFIVQFPVYIKSFFSIKGYLPITIVLLFVKPEKKSIPFLILFICFVLLYSFHYRSKYVIESQEMSLFETYRYMTNTIPFLLGYFLFSKKTRFKFRKFYILLFVFFMIKSSMYMKEFIEDENQNYHYVNDYIKSKYGDDILIVDNFNMISILNHPAATNIINNDLELLNYCLIKNSNDIVLINRFNDSSSNEILKTYPFKIDKEFLNKSVQLYFLNKNFIDSNIIPKP